jgi:Alcohol dehydrogenase GroES-like domain/Integrase core domain
MRAVQIRTFGEPGIVLELADLPEPPAAAAGQVLIGVEYAPINMNDLYLIHGVYPVRPSLPSVVGNEGVGRVLAIGGGVDHLKVGDRVLVPQVVRVGVTRHPTAQWTAQQLREATPFGAGPEFLIRDNDGKFDADFDRAARGAGIRVLRTAIRAPLINSVCERFLGSVRRECLDHMMTLGERHLEQVLEEYCLRYFNAARPHRGLDQHVPTPEIRTGCTTGSAIRSVSVLGGLHHDYRTAA